jgi:uncharacterized membrane protein YhhN
MGMTFEITFWALMAVSAAAAVAYGTYFLDRPRTWARALVKTAFMGAMTGAFVVAGAPFPLVLALAASTLGDFFLAFDKAWTLPLGIVSFLLAQLLYFVIFAGLWFFSGDNAPLEPRYALMLAIVVFTIGVLVWLWRDDLRAHPISTAVTVFLLFATGVLLPFFVVITFMPGALSELFTSLLGAGATPPPATILYAPFAVLAAAIIATRLRRDLGVTRLGAMLYAGMITAMACMAMWMPWAAWPAIAGALFFVVSDFVLATELFRLPADAPQRRITAPVVWWTYVAAQVLIVWGVVLAVFAN